MKFIERTIIALLILTPLLFGTVEPWSLAVMETACIALLFLWIIGATKARGPRPGIVVPPLLIPAAILLAIPIVQILPLPQAVVKLLSPQTFRVYAETSPPGDNLSWLTLSLYPQATLLELARLTAYICVYILAAQFLRDRESITRMASAVLAAGVVIALIGIFQRIFWNGKILWFREIGDGSPFSTYVNRNHFAGLMELIIPVGIGMCIYLLPSIRSADGFKTFASEFLVHSRTNRLVLYFTGVVIMITALFLSLSRGAIVGLSLSMVLFGAMLLVRSSTRKKGWFIVAVFLIILFTVGWFGWRPIIERFGKPEAVSELTQSRMVNWKDSWEIAKDFPLFGTGLGTYEHIYPRYKTISRQERWEHAHNDYIEGAVELGVSGALVGFYAVVSFFVLMFRALRSRRSHHARLLGIGGMTGIVAILIHSLTDFNMHIGANGLYFSLLFGFSVAASRVSARDGDDRTVLRLKEATLPSGFRTPLIAGMALFCAALSAVPVLNAVSEAYYSLAKGPLGERGDVLASKREVLRKAQSLSPLDSRLSFALGNIDLALDQKMDALRNYARAVELNPLNGEQLQLLGSAYDAIGRPDMAERYMNLSLLYDPTSAWKHKNYALWLFSRGKKEAAMTEMRKAIALDPSNTRKYITSMILAGLSAEEMKGVMPGSSPLVHFGRYREEIGDTEGALEAYIDALLAAKREGVDRTGFYSAVAGIYEKIGMFEEALSFFEEGIRENPDNYGLRFGLARLYDRMNITYRAREEYEKVLTLHPSDEYAQRRLKELAQK